MITGMHIRRVSIAVEWTLGHRGEFRALIRLLITRTVQMRQTLFGRTPLEWRLFLFFLALISPLFKVEYGSEL